MKKRSISHRNLLGGFCGGVLGILLFNLIHPMVLPLGVIIGVVAGYWYQEIWVSMKQEWIKVIRKYNASVSVITSFPSIVVLGVNKKTKIILEKLLIIVSRFRSFIKSLKRVLSITNIGMVLWIIFDICTLGIAGWLKKHPINRAYFVRFLAFVLFLSTCSLISYFILIKTGAVNFSVNTNPIITEGLASGLIFVGSFLIFLMAMMSGVNEITSMSEQSSTGEIDQLITMRRFYKIWSEFSTKGPLLLFFSSLGRMFISLTFVMVLVIIVFSYALIIGAVVLVFSTIPLLLLIGSLKGIYKITKKPNHWFCVLVTLITTLTFGFLTKDYITNTYILWTVALVTGAISGITTELTRRVVSLIFKGKLEDIVLAEILVKITPAWKTFNTGLEKSLQLTNGLRL